MELRVQLKICEGCGCLWYRIQNQGAVYCRACESRLSEFPAPTTRKRRWAPKHRPSTHPHPAECLAGGAQ